jgi:N-acetyltransferase
MIFDFLNNYVLEDDMVCLRPLADTDAPYLLPFALHEPDIWRYSLLSASGKEGLEHYISLATEGRAQQKEYAFIVFDKRRQQYAGTTRFYDIQLAHKSLQLGYTWYGKDFQGTGLNKHCKYLLLAFAFDTMGIERVEFRADVNNQKSIAAMKSIGCQEEGVLRSHTARADGSRRDCIVLSILKAEWDNGGRERLAGKIV